MVARSRAASAIPTPATATPATAAAAAAGAAGLSLLVLQALRIVASTQPLASLGDAFGALLRKESIPVVRTSDDDRARWTATKELGASLALNEPTTHNFDTLVSTLAAKLDADCARDGQMPSTETANLVQLTTIYLRHFVAHGPMQWTDHCPALETRIRLVTVLTRAIVDVPLTHATHDAYESMLLLFLAILADQVDFIDADPNDDDEPAISPMVLALRACSLDPGPLIQRLFSLATAAATADPPASANVGLFGYRAALRWAQASVADASAALVLYTLVVKNGEFREVVLAQTDPDALLVPILKFIYQAFFQPINHGTVPTTPITPTGTSSLAVPAPTVLAAANSVPYDRIYTHFATLLTLTHDDAYLAALMRVTVAAPAWLGDRRILALSLADLTVLVLMRVIQGNLATVRDRYLHAQCAAMLANLARGWQHVHPAVALRLVRWVDVVARRVAKLAVGAVVGIEDGNETASAATTPSSPRFGRRGSWSVEAGGEVNPPVDYAVYVDVAALLVHVLAAVLHPVNVRFNAHVVVALLVKADVLAPLRSEPQIAAVVARIEASIAYFRTKIPTGQSPDAVVRHVADAAMAYRPQPPPPAPELAAEYHEDVDTGAFLSSVAWRAVYAGIWTPDARPAALDEGLVDVLAELGGVQDEDVDLDSRRGSLDQLPAVSVVPASPRGGGRGGAL
ncbi:hypothetical protein AMAG_16501 [Allomyces macrogynus ATCC 38327]|uniref:Dymeclin n=1 Tax=Allomyces macrogynus (strain ATCC 38327) TaxID=578462 RepID=A0A0L0TCD0_ALLM3|nr:hypothetical protein AMAG_16501 [Allomyces macrogynus ATCC 38327]|eukprot:KNE72458.1 hypothetical protein AMAG_16501 [Allomyces macrogynus ATCC 38327]